MVGNRLQQEHKKSAPETLAIETVPTSLIETVPAANNIPAPIGTQALLNQPTPSRAPSDMKTEPKDKNCHELLTDAPGQGLNWRLECFLIHMGTPRSFQAGGKEAIQSDDASSSPKRRRVEGERTVLDLVLGDKTGPVLATFWDEAAKQIQQLHADANIATE